MSTPILISHLRLAYTIGFSDNLGTKSYNAYKDATSYSFSNGRVKKGYLSGWKDAQRIKVSVRREMVQSSLEVEDYLVFKNVMEQK